MSTDVDYLNVDKHVDHVIVMVEHTVECYIYILITILLNATIC